MPKRDDVPAYRPCVGVMLLNSQGLVWIGRRFDKVNDEGKGQAARIGQWLRSQGLDQADVHSSPWCRCRQTAELLGLGPVSVEASLASFFADPRQSARQNRSLQDFIARTLRSKRDRALVLVTHHVNIREFMGRDVGSGDMVLARVDAQGFLHLAGRRKNLLITSYGRNISPEWVESQVLAHPGMRECLVLGDARPYCSALLFAPSLDDTTINGWLDQINAGLPDYARVLRWQRLPAPLQSNPDLTTANGRPRRDRIAQQLHTLIDALYAPSEETCS